MEAKLVSELPDDGWQFEPKWDGFRCLAHCRGADVVLISKSGKSLGRYFPEMADALAALQLDDVVLDGELVVAQGDHLSFGALQARLHPAASRIERLSRETPAQLILFDCLMADGKSLTAWPLSRRRKKLEQVVSQRLGDRLLLSPYSLDREQALAWLARSGSALDGIIAKRREGPYRCSERAMVKLKERRSADCVIGGFRYETEGLLVGSLLLGLYDQAGRLNHVGFCSGLSDDEKPALTKKLERLIGAPGFTGKSPGGKSRWATERSVNWQPLKPELVVEVLYDQVTDDRFRHGTRLLRWRPDKAPKQCGSDQLQRELKPSELADILVESS